MSVERKDFGIFMAPFHRVGENPTLSLERNIQLIQWLDELGFDEAWIGEHHSAGWEIIASPEVFMATVAERTRHIRLGTGVISLPYHHPLMVANRMVLLDHLTRGRAMLGVGPGALVSDAHMLGIQPSRQREMMDESMGVIMRLFRRDRALSAMSATGSNCMMLCCTCVPTNALTCPLQWQQPNHRLAPRSLVKYGAGPALPERASTRIWKGDAGRRLGDRRGCCCGVGRELSAAMTGAWLCPFTWPKAGKRHSAKRGWARPLGLPSISMRRWDNPCPMLHRSGLSRKWSTAECGLWAARTTASPAWSSLKSRAEAMAGCWSPLPSGPPARRCCTAMNCWPVMSLPTSKAASRALENSRDWARDHVDYLDDLRKGSIKKARSDYQERVGEAARI